MTAALLVALLGACSSSSPSSGGHAAASAGQPDGTASADPSISAAAASPGDATAAAARWGLQPFAPAPAPPAVKPLRTASPVPPVYDHVPTDRKIVFVTIDDGVEKDPKFVDMMKDLGVPITMFLTDKYVAQDPGYFKQLQALGNHVENHTLTHPDMPKLAAAAQQHEVCGQQDRIQQEFGARPYLFRPPYGDSNAVTQQVAGSCGITAIIKWRETMEINDMEYQGAKQLHPGDIVLCHFRGPAELKGTTMTQMMTNLFRHIQQQGFTIARLEDYV